MESIGRAALEKLHKELLIDELWTIRGDREFSWIGHRLKQTVRGSKSFQDDGITLSRLSATCVVVEGVSAPQADVLRLLSRMNRHAIGSAYTYWPATRSISTDAVAYVHEQTLEWRSSQFGSFTITQLCLAESEADWLAEKTGGTVAVREHPTSGRRIVSDDMLNVLEDAFVADGWRPSLFANQFEMETIADITRHSPRVASMGGSAGGVALEVSFGGDTSLTRIHTEEPHRRLGNGLTVRLNLPISVTPDDADRIAASLNAQEAAGSATTTHYGAWCWDTWPATGLCLAYQAFIPNALYRPGIAQDVAYSFIKRAQWADRVLNQKPSTASVWKTLAKRFGVSGSDEGAD
jgi:hypothetical protein